MAGITIQTLALICAAIFFTVDAAPQYGNVEEPHNILDIETPTAFDYDSPLREPDSLRSRPYFDFLSTLYRRDSTKSELFRPYARTRRAATDLAVTQLKKPQTRRLRRAIVFRPLFVYKQQQIRREKVEAKRRRI